MKEKNFEDYIHQQLEKYGWTYKESIYRSDDQDVWDLCILKQKIIEINNIDESEANKAIFEIQKINFDYITMNYKCWKFLLEGVKVWDSVTNQTKSIKLISDNYMLNDYIFTRQFRVSDGSTTRIPDIVMFINGLPIAILELKSELAFENIEDAFNQNESLKLFCPKLWSFNIFNFISNRLDTRYGTVTSSYQKMIRANNMKTRDDRDIIEFLFERKNIIDYITKYSFFSDEKGFLSKYIAAPHQVEAVINSMNNILDDNAKGGLVWHTQGSGKSVTMIFLAKSIIIAKPKTTIIMLTDRKTLDLQLYQRFTNASYFLRNKPILVESRKDLIVKLENKKYFGIYFTTIQKFFSNTGILSNRKDICVLVDEAHRTQNNIEDEYKISKEVKKLILKSGYAKFMRSALPNAKFVGFTGTPLIGFEKDSKKIFGEYNHKYLMSDSTEDGTTVPIHYEMRKLEIPLNQEYLDIMDKLQEEYISTLDPDKITSHQNLNKLMESANINDILENKNIILEKSKDILKHYDSRNSILNNKVMIVANSRNAAYLYYKTITELRPEIKNEVILVITGNNKDSLEMKNSIVQKKEINSVESEFRKDTSKYKIAIVVDMWLTGFDVPDLETLYMDKVIKWHNLIQAIARVNRTYENNLTKKIKYNGLIVDYIGIWNHIADALLQYSNNKRIGFGISIENIEEAKKYLLDTINIINDNYMKNINNFNNLNDTEKYNYIILSYEKLLSINDNNSRNEFIKLARNIGKYLKMSFSIIEDDIKQQAKGIVQVSKLLTRNIVVVAGQLEETIYSIKNAIKDCIDSSKSDIEIKSSILTKNIYDVAQILEHEVKELQNIYPHVALKMYKSGIQLMIDELDKTRPIAAKKMSEKIRDILSGMQANDNIEKIIELIREIAKEIINKIDEPVEFEDSQLQAFYEIIADDQYLRDNKNSEILRRLAKDIYQTVVKAGTEQFETSGKVKSHIKVELHKLLKNKYNYPPDNLKDISGLLINQITKSIRLNKDYFKRER
ncbi:HsdR family type I site-specific deoxyribonuclease [Spiroplasma endosymbiont of Aspidapion aeneum]|uniref:type I restriction endonuclease subunit R n=1 Tax=Spiroplasma endosymbiont of Aspidapion aeneum TaxID=3066276 RepID=UPI00313E2C29